MASRAAVPLTLAAAVTAVRGIGPAFAARLAARGVHTVGDLLLHFPLDYLDPSACRPAPVAQEPALYRLRVEAALGGRPRFGRRPAVLRVRTRLGEAAIQLVFFNRSWMAGSLRPGTEVLAYGRMENGADGWKLLNPLVLPAAAAAGLVPLYAPLAGISPGRVRNLVAEVLAALEGEEEEWLPATVLERHGFPPALAALRTVHRPPSASAGRQARARFLYGEFLLFQLELHHVREFFTKRPRRWRYQAGLAQLPAALERLPFALTAEQHHAVNEVCADLCAPWAMKRLLQGDVGSGKTVVALLALFLAAASGLQGAFLAPTELLAVQHRRSARLFWGDDRAALLTSSTPAGERRAVLAALAAGEIQVVFGTHALLEEAVQFRRLGLVVIDEQHRFGVGQRARLHFKGEAVDLLVTTATPIPRTMLLSLYRDLDVSVLRQGPPGRSPVVTKIIPRERREELYAWLRKRVERGEKGYIILPLIEASETMPEVGSLEEETPHLRRLFAPHALGVISGRSAHPEKSRVLDDFAAGRVRVVAATTVVEVGIDVRDAVFIVIENADRYGLAQLHQLRGRVGRGPLPAVCYLLASPAPSESGRKRLETIAATTDGFRIAETDLRMRGGGMVSGQAQSGELDFRCADVQRDYPWLRAARRDAARLLRAHRDGDEAALTPCLRRFLEGVSARLHELHFG